MARAKPHLAAAHHAGFSHLDGLVLQDIVGVHKSDTPAEASKPSTLNPKP